MAPQSTITNGRSRRGPCSCSTRAAPSFACPGLAFEEHCEAGARRDPRGGLTAVRIATDAPNSEPMVWRPTAPARAGGARGGAEGCCGRRAPGCRRADQSRRRRASPSTKVRRRRRRRAAAADRAERELEWKGATGVVVETSRCAHRADGERGLRRRAGGVPARGRDDDEVQGQRAVAAGASPARARAGRAVRSSSPFVRRQRRSQIARAPKSPCRMAPCAGCATTAPATPARARPAQSSRRLRSRR